MSVNQTYNLNFLNHCLLCLQHVDPFVQNKIINENPLGLQNFQQMLQLIVGDVTLQVDKEEKADNNSLNGLPPLCAVCYDILSELHAFYSELKEIQRKIQSQTEAARRIVKGTMGRGRMKSEFFRRLKIGGVLKTDINSMELFIGNFHQLVVEADRKEPEIYSIKRPRTFTEIDNNAANLQSTPIKFTLPAIQAAEVHGDTSKGHDIEVVVLDDSSNDDEMQQGNGSSDNYGTTVTVENNGITRSREVGLFSSADPLAIGYEEEENGRVVLEQQQEEHENVLMAVVGNGAALEEGERRNETMMENSAEMFLNRQREGNYSEGDNDVEKDGVGYWNRLLPNVIFEDVDSSESTSNGEEAGDGVEREGDDELEVLPVISKQVELIDLSDDDDINGMEEQGNLTAGVENEMIIGGNVECVDEATRVTQMECVGGTSSHLPINPGKKGVPSNDKPFQHWCTHCGQGFHSRYMLKCHMYLHKPGGRSKPWMCQYCKREFAVRKLMEEHENIHTGERPYQCEICTVRFRQRSSLCRHKKLHKKQQLKEQQQMEHGIPMLPITAFLQESFLIPAN